MIYGYCRISTDKQNIERQIRNIKAEYPDAVIVTDEYTGTELDRPGWTKIYKAAKAGDVIVFDSVSRMSRDAEEGFQVYEELFRRGVELIFLKEPQINTETYKKAMDGQIQLAIKSGNVAADELIGVGDYACGGAPLSGARGAKTFLKRLDELTDPIIESAPRVAVVSDYRRPGVFEFEADND